MRKKREKRLLERDNPQLGYYYIRVEKHNYINDLQ
jgi:hypothetical protein